MSKEYSMNLFQNAIDSLDESINFYKISLSDESKYKFCIILLSHFMELMLKFFVEEQNPLLCYVKPYSDKIKREKTITWNQAVHILLNSSIVINESLRTQFSKLANLRNDIIHYKFEYNTSEIRKIIIEIVSGLKILHETILKKDFYNEVNENTKRLLEEIADGYKKDLHLAQVEVIEEANGNEIYNCELCGEENTVTENDGLYFCHFCKETDKIEECVRCFESFRESELINFGETKEGYSLYICEYCNDIIKSG